jgi:glycosyltransferase involved in cell wall biosynthesis
VSDISVSAIVTAFQLERFIADAIRSVQAQTRPVDEIIVVDNGSTDSTLNIVRDLSRHDERIRLAEETERGVSQVRNCGIRAAQGDAIAILDGDDTWPADKIEHQAARLGAAPRVDIVTGLTAVVEAIDSKTLCPPPEARTETMQHVNVGACLYRRSLFDEIGLFDPDLRYVEDWDLMLRIRDAGMPIAALTEVMLYYRRYAGSHVTTPDPRKTQEVARVFGLSRRRRQKLGLPPAPPFHGELIA